MRESTCIWPKSISVTDIRGGRVWKVRRDMIMKDKTLRKKQRNHAKQIKKEQGKIQHLYLFDQKANISTYNRRHSFVSRIVEGEGTNLFRNLFNQRNGPDSCRTVHHQSKLFIQIISETICQFVLVHHNLCYILR